MSAGEDTSAAEPPQDGAEDALRKRIGVNLKRVRMLIDENRSRLGEEFGVHNARWSKWEDGLTLPDIGVMIAFCDRYELTLDYIYRGLTDGLDEHLVGLLYKAYPEMLDAAAAKAADPEPKRPAPTLVLVPPSAGVPRTRAPSVMPVGSVAKNA